MEFIGERLLSEVCCSTLHQPVQIKKKCNLMAAAGVDEKCSRGNWWTEGRDVQRNARHVIVECTHSASHRCWKLLQIVMSTMIVSAHVYMNKNKTRTVATVLGGCRSNHLYTIHYYYYYFNL